LDAGFEADGGNALRRNGFLSRHSRPET